MNRFSRGADGLCSGQLSLWVALENQEVAIELVLLILLTAGAYVGWNIGANDTASDPLKGPAPSAKTLIIILVGWVLTPCLAAFSSFMVYRLLNPVFF